MTLKHEYVFLLLSLSITRTRPADAAKVDIWEKYMYRWHSHFVYNLELSGTASGGSLVFFSTGGPEKQFFSIGTREGETAQSVLQRLDDPIRDRMIGSEDTLLVHGGIRLLGWPGGYALAGTERGLGIPRAPLFLSGSYKKAENAIVFKWENLPGEYDVVVTPTDMFDSTTTSCVRRLVENDAGRFCIMAFRGKAPSNAGFIHVAPNSQEELTSPPFTCDVMPNWCSWVSLGATKAASFEQGKRPNGNFIGNHFTPDGKPLYQIVKTKTAEAQAGIWRKWLGLTPEHTYRVYVRLNTLEMDRNTNAWSLSFHVATNPPGGKAFSTEQLAGQSALPDGSKGADAAQMVRYGPGNTTKGAWVTSTMDIVLSPGVDTITTWLRHSGADSTGVGMDWIKVEDLTR
jgi:hypothetical protein